ncbi:uncharacterized protein LOC133929685 [Phragmites australis]|uniref:uncharacterized protein LOC133929685 n=1 Tax=Phragmites australis TaxID=29695 RepID=UPI002D78A2A6|nr:uncharacterized protein LOC133929685 [Phragmites australis]
MKTHHHPNSQPGIQIRNLRGNQLGGVIFGCKPDTIEECFRKQLFGLPSIHYSYVKNVKPGLPLFLFNYSDRKLHGLFEAASSGQLSIDPYAWSDDGSLRTPFPAQVRFCTKTRYPPMRESQYKTVLGDNYYTQYYFYFELDHAQTKALISVFKSLGPANFKQVPPVSSERSLVTQRKVTSLPPTKGKASAVPDPKKVTANLKDTNPFSILSNTSGFVPDNWADSDAGNASVSENSHSDTDEKEVGEPVSDWEDLDENALQHQFSPHSNPDEVSQNSSYKTVCQGMELAECSHPVANPVNRERHNFEKDMLVNSHNEHIGAVSVDKIESEAHNNPGSIELQPERQTILKKLKDLCFLRQQAALSSQDCVDSSSDECVPEETQVKSNLSCDQFGATVEDSTPFEQYHGDYTELRQIIAKLTKRTRELEKKQNGSDQDILFLREVVKDSGRKVQQLEYLVDELQFKFDSSLSLLGSMCNNIGKPSIFLIGGYNGVTWLSSLDSFSPEKDIMVGLTPMGYARSYASAAPLDGHIFAFGGGDGMSWYNTVECYSSRNNEWMECPSLNRKKGSLAGISLNSKIYAIGGGDENETYSEVEMFDPYLGKWICSPSMLLPRFALAAAELNGVIYAAGGYDGNMYLKSAERYDPREGVWVQLPSMNTRRGCQALTVVGEALYAMGGYDGEKMVSSVEIYDPRLNAWRMGDPMSTPRGYAAAVNLDDSLFLIGGLRSKVQILDTVEVYSASSGWSVLGFGSIGKRSFASAIVM